MDMFTSYGHIEKPKQITDFLMILVWASPFNCNMTHRQINLYRMFIADFSVNSHKIFMNLFFNSGANAAPVSVQALPVQCHYVAGHWCWPW